VFGNTQNHKNMTKATSDVWATNAAGDKRRFTRMSWNLLKAGKDGSKDGWRELPDTIIHNTVQPKTVIEKPATGNGSKTAQIIDNTVTSKKDEVIDNVVTKKDNTVIVSVPVTDDQKAEFNKSADGLKKGDIKDFFDRQNPKVEYSNGWKPSLFIEKLGEHLNYDIVALQKAFN
jgi:hypothetical protein